MYAALSPTTVTPPCAPVFLSARSSISPSLHPRQTNRGAAFQQCPLSKHLYCGVLLTLLCQTKPRSQWNNPAGWRPSAGSFRAAELLQNSKTDSPGTAIRAKQETNFACVCARLLKANWIQSSLTTLTYLPDKQIFFIQAVV